MTRFEIRLARQVMGTLYCVYIIDSQAHAGRYYIGFTENLAAQTP